MQIQRKARNDSDVDALTMTFSIYREFVGNIIAKHFGAISIQEKKKCDGQLIGGGNCYATQLNFLKMCNIGLK